MVASLQKSTNYYDRFFKLTQHIEQQLLVVQGTTYSPKCIQVTKKVYFYFYK